MLRQDKLIKEITHIDKSYMCYLFLAVVTSNVNPQQPTSFYNSPKHAIIY